MTVAGAEPGPLAGVLPCVEANIEVLLRHAGVADLLTSLGGPCTIDARPMTELRLSPFPRDEWITRCTGLRLARAGADDGAALTAQLRQRAGAGVPVLVYADSYTVPWNPYAGHEHHEHAFVVDGVDTVDGVEVLHVVDAYTNATRYGNAEPGDRWVPAGDLARELRPVADRFQLRHLEGTLHPADPAVLAAEVTAANLAVHHMAAAHGRDAAALAAFAAGGGLGFDELAWLTLAVWLVSRSRQAHVRWWQDGHCRGADGAPAVLAAAEPVTTLWQTAQTMCYLAWRRVEAGRPCPPTLGGALAEAAAAETRWFAAMAAATTAT